MDAKNSIKRNGKKRNYDFNTILELWVKSGSRCEMHGCNKYLFEDEKKGEKVKIGEKAHIYAFSSDGPRPNNYLNEKEKNSVENLMLLCPSCHRIIDNNKLTAKYNVNTLTRFKADHEYRIKELTGMGKDYSSTVIRMVGNIRGVNTKISEDEIKNALFKSSRRFPKYLNSYKFIELDLTKLPLNDSVNSYRIKCEMIDEAFETLIIPSIRNDEIKHMSIFAFERIPLLIYLGFKLDSKIPVDIYQKHRDKEEGWVWFNKKNKNSFELKKIQNGENKSDIVLLLSLSGKINIKMLPKVLRHNYDIFEIMPNGNTQSRNLLSDKYSLLEFKKTFEHFLDNIYRENSNVKVIHLFPAIPISAAITCGRALMKNVSPQLLIYDKISKTYKKTLKVN